jgi:hypothetical protein
MALRDGNAEQRQLVVLDDVLLRMGEKQTTR